MVIHSIQKNNMNLNIGEVATPNQPLDKYENIITLIITNALMNLF